jgi:hypothetical protein
LKKFVASTEVTRDDSDFSRLIHDHGVHGDIRSASVITSIMWCAKCFPELTDDYLLAESVKTRTDPPRK